MIINHLSKEMTSCIEVISCWCNLSRLLALHSSGKVTGVHTDQIDRQRVCIFHHCLRVVFVSVGDETSFCCDLPSHTPNPASSISLWQADPSFDANLRPISAQPILDILNIRFQRIKDGRDWRTTRQVVWSFGRPFGLFHIPVFVYPNVFVCLCVRVCMHLWLLMCMILRS